MRQLLHIGYPKTGTSWFQKNFYPNVTNYVYAQRRKVQDELMVKGPFDWNAEECKTYFEGLGNHVVLCEELLLGRLRPGGMKHFLTKAFADRLHQVFPNGKIIIFIRKQPEALASAYLEYLKAGGNYSIDRFLFPEKIAPGEYNKLVLLGIEFFNYLPVVDYYCSLFGIERVHLFLYEDFCQSNKMFIKKFSGFFDFDTGSNTINYSPENAGYTPLLIPLAKFINAFSRYGPLNKYYLLHVPGMHKFGKWALARLNQIIGRQKPVQAEQVLGKRNYRYIQEYFRPSNTALMKKYNLYEMEKFGYHL
ncbi:MAG: hypothetical protein JXB34_04710 [Bacteroidales bacterium]|nr:hypothetical protein [Bacteroidales bacterium]